MTINFLCFISIDINTFFRQFLRWMYPIELYFSLDLEIKLELKRK